VTLEEAETFDQIKDELIAELEKGTFERKGTKNY